MAETESQAVGELEPMVGALEINDLAVPPVTISDRLWLVAALQFVQHFQKRPRNS